MSVQTKAMNSVFFFASGHGTFISFGTLIYTGRTLILTFIFFICRDDVNAFHVDKPMIYINFFDDVVTTNNATSKLIEKGLSTTSTPVNSTNKGLKKRQDLLTDILKLNDENKTSASESSDAVFEFDLPSKADITEFSTNESDHPTTAGISDLMDPEFLEPELTRMFFMRAIASMIEHLMVALFSVEDQPKISEPPGFDYESSPSRNIKKRDLSSADNISKSSTVFENVKQNFDSKTTLISTDESKKKTSEISTSEIKSSEQVASSHSTHASESLETIKKLIEQSSPSPSPTLVSEHSSSHLNTHESTVKQHANKRESEANFGTNLKFEHQIDNVPDGKIVQRGKLVAHRSVAIKPEPIDEESMFQFGEESPILADEGINKRETRFHEGPAGDHNRKAENLADKEERVAQVVVDATALDDSTDTTVEYGDQVIQANFRLVNNPLTEPCSCWASVSVKGQNKTSFVEMLFLAGTITLILVIFGALALAAGYVIRKRQESGNQNAANMQCTVA